MSPGAKNIFGLTLCGALYYQCLAPTAFAQLSSNDIEEFRERGYRGNRNVTVTSCFTNYTGNIDCSEAEIPDISDITYVIDYLYGSHEPLCCPDEADVDGSGGEPDISDITALIDHLYLSHFPLPDCT